MKKFRDLGKRSVDSVPSFSLPNSPAAWAAMVLSWHYPAGIDFYDLVTNTQLWMTADEKTRKNANTVIFCWLNQNIDWLVDCEVIKDFRISGGMLTVTTHPYIIGTSELSYSRCFIETAVGHQDNQIEKYFRTSK